MHLDGQKLILRICVRVAQQTLTLYVWVRILDPQPRLPTEIDDVGEIPEPTRVSGIFYCKNHSENKKMTFGKKVGLQGFEPLHTLLKGGICEN